MCLIVMYGINKKADKSLMEKMFYFEYDAKPMINEFQLNGNGLEDYDFYNIGVCNCDSYITMLKDSKFNNFVDYYNNLKSEFAKRIQNVEDLKNNPKYEKLKAKFVKEFDKKRKEMQKYAVTDTKYQNGYKNWLNKNKIFSDALLGGLENDKCEYVVNTSTNDLINKNVVEIYDKDTSIIDGVFTTFDDIIIIPIWTDVGKYSYDVSFSDINYSDLDYNKLGALQYNCGFKILNK